MAVDVEPTKRRVALVLIAEVEGDKQDELLDTLSNFGVVAPAGELVRQALAPAPQEQPQRDRPAFDAYGNPYDGMSTKSQTHDAYGNPYDKSKTGRGASHDSYGNPHRR